MKIETNPVISQGGGLDEKNEIKIIRQHFPGYGWYVGFCCKKKEKLYFNERYITLPLLEYGDDLKHWLSTWLNYFKSEIQSSKIKFD
jgi:hypothetical protein